MVIMIAMMMKASKNVTLEVSDWQMLELGAAARGKSLSAYLGRLLQLGTLKERELDDQERQRKQAEMMELLRKEGEEIKAGPKGKGRKNVQD